jgi:hypothetical protein
VIRFRLSLKSNGVVRTSAQGAEVFCGRGDGLPKEADDDPARGLRADFHVEETFARHLGLQVHGPLQRTTHPTRHQPTLGLGKARRIGAPSAVRTPAAAARTMTALGARRAPSLSTGSPRAVAERRASPVP